MISQFQLTMDIIWNYDKSDLKLYCINFSLTKSIPNREDYGLVEYKYVK